MNPKISVVMPVYNGERYLKEAMESVLNQTFKDFEFIIINDGSTDSTEKIIQGFSDPRIVYLDNGGNLGLSRSFNRGIQVARGEYIARMDADDISLPDRFEKQIKFLEANPQIGVLGSNIKIIGTNKIFKRPENHKAIKWQSLLSTPVVHPTVMARANILKNNPYDDKLHNSEDYELWSRLIFEKDAGFANLQEPLLLYRVFPKSFTQSLDPDKKINTAKNIIRNIERYILLSDYEKQNLLEQNYRTFSVYRRAAREFKKREGFKPFLFPQVVFMLKRFLK